MTSKKTTKNAYKAYLFGYNGKELENEIKGTGNTYDYGARFYDAQLGRFHSVDRFAEKYPSMSPYQYGANNPVLFIDVNGNSLRIDKNTSFSFKVKTVFTLAVNYTFSSTARKYIKDAMSKDTPMNIITESKRDFSYTVPMEIYKHNMKEPEVEFEFDTETLDMVETIQSKEKYEKWEAAKKDLTAHKDGTGDGTMIFLSFSKKFRNDIKKFDKKRGYIHVVTAHEFGHVHNNNHGINIYRGDIKHRNEILPLKIQNAAAKEFNRFRIRKFKTNVNTYE